MRTLSRRTPEDDVELARLEAQLTRQWTELRPPIVMEWSEASVLALDRGTPWLYGPAERDPLRNRRGHLVVPRRQRAELAAIAARGVPFQRVAVAHELDLAGPVRDLLPVLRQGPTICTDETARRLVGPLPAHPGVTRAARVLDAVVGGFGSATGLILDHVLDPIVFGVIAPCAPRPGELSLWFPLVAWRW